MAGDGGEMAGRLRERSEASMGLRAEPEMAASSREIAGDRGEIAGDGVHPSAQEMAGGNQAIKQEQLWLPYWVDAYSLQVLSPEGLVARKR